MKTQHEIGQMKFEIEKKMQDVRTEIFKDGNGAGESWIDFSHDIATELVRELSDENITLLNFHEEYVVEWIAEQIYLDKEKCDE